MADDRVKEIISKFLLDTCQQRQLPNYFVSSAAYNCVYLSTGYSSDDDGVSNIPLTTGSLAEFYIQPMLPCVGDMDIMHHRNNELAIPAGTPPPTQLPADFHSRVLVFDIIDSGFPGYVYLMTSYLLTECSDDGKYNAVQCERQYGLQLKAIKAGYDVTQHGPALHSKCSIPRDRITTAVTTLIGSLELSIDLVPCVRCLSWPPQAADWPTRHRNYGWPDSATVDRVVSNGCDLVRVAHRQCRQHEWMNTHQFRLSFSRAEVVLLNSWMPVQQLVYHVLRDFMKTERLLDITDNSGSKMFSNYHIKTLMLWACELKPRNWWTEDLNVVRICVELLHTLAFWLTDARCQHYFISNCNLTDHPDHEYYAQLTAGKLTAVTEKWLVEWLMDKHIRKFARRCADSVSRLFEDTSTATELQKALSAVTDERLMILRLMSLGPCLMTQFNIAFSVSHDSLTVRSCLCWMKELAKMHRGLSVYFTAVTFLHVARNIRKVLLRDALLDVLATTCLQSNDARLCRRARHSSVLSLSQAAMLMKVVANNSRSTVQLIEIELSKAYLYRALRCKDSDSDSIYCLADVYLAVLYYTAGQYQTAIDHCTLVTRSQGHSQCSSHVVQGELLPKIDDEVDTVIGLAVFYQYVRSAALNQQQQTQHVTVFTTELFARYLHIRCLSVTKCHQLTQATLDTDMQRYQNRLYESSEVFITDVLIANLLNRVRHPESNQRFTEFNNLAKKPAISLDFDTSELVELLQQSAVEHLTTFRQLEARDFGSIAILITTDFEALYAYKCGEYQRCLQLSTHNVRTLIGGDRHLPCVYAYPEFIQLVDNEISSLVGLILIAGINRSDARNAFQFTITQLSLSLYLMTQCQIKLRHSVTSVAQTLDYIEVVPRITQHDFPQPLTLDLMLLKLTERKILRYISVDSQYEDI